MTGQQQFDWVGQESSEPGLPDHWPRDSDWTDALQHALATSVFQTLQQFVKLERQTETVYPAAENVFAAFRETSYAGAKVVILGQDPYHGPGQAEGLSFSVPEGVSHPPSLRNIFKELHQDLGQPIPESGSLISWARQGVLLLNTVLTVRAGEAHSHRKQGWELFTDEVIKTLSDRQQPLVFVLWGKPAEKKAQLIDPGHELIVSAHPSPLSASRGFFGSRPFSRTNDALRRWGQQPIDW